jgi:uncharacterized membrane protein YqgA involved in biofilm formation
MTGTLLNAAAIIAGGSIGLIFKAKLPKRYHDIFFQAIGLFTLLLGVKMSIAMTLPLLVVLSLVLGGFAGTRLNLAMRTEQLGEYLKTRMKIANDRFTEGLVTGFLLFCVGSMTIIGAMEEGLGKPADLLFTKSIMDFFSSALLAAALGSGVLFAVAPLIVFQGGITLLASIVGSGIPPVIISELTAVGGIILIGLGITLLQIKKIEIINLLPAMIFICFFVWIKTIL